MAKVTLVATAPYKGRAAGESFVTSLKNSRALIADGTATLPNVKKQATKKAAAKKAPAKKAAKKVPAKKAAKTVRGGSTYRTRAMKAK